MSGRTALILALAILAEVVATTALKASDGFSRLWPSLVVVGGYGIAFLCMSVAMRSVPIGIIYALWSGIGIVLITVAGFAIYGERLDAPALVGLGLIVAGVVVINALSGSVRG